MVILFLDHLLQEATGVFYATKKQAKVDGQTLANNTPILCMQVELITYVCGEREGEYTHTYTYIHTAV